MRPNPPCETISKLLRSNERPVRIVALLLYVEAPTLNELAGQISSAFDAASCAPLAIEAVIAESFLLTMVSSRLQAVRRRCRQDRGRRG